MSDKASAVKPAKKKAPHVGEATVSLRHNFTDPEYREIGVKLNIARTNYTTLETELKTLSTDYKARIGQQEAVVDEMSNKLGTGYEMRQTKVQVVFNASKGRKYFYALDDKKRKTAVGEADMMPSDFQVEALPIVTADLGKKPDAATPANAIVLTQPLPATAGTEPATGQRATELPPCGASA